MFDIRENLKKLPASPGVYMHKDKLGTVIYVGKARSLKNRVRQYFQKYGKSTPKLRALTSQIASFEYIRCATEMEALILENNLIKKYMPRYNVLLRDDKTYPYIVVTTSEPFPRLMKTRLFQRNGDRYFGPYSDADAVNRVVTRVNDLFRLKRCSALHFPAGQRPCLHYHIEECRGICLGKVDQRAYRADIEKILAFLAGKDKSILEETEKKMHLASDLLRFEEAAQYRDFLEAAEQLKQVQRVSLPAAEDLDVVLPLRSGREAYIVLFSIRDGKLVGRESFALQMEETDPDAALTAAFLKQYYGNTAYVPRRILMEEEPEEKALLEEFLSADGACTISVPKRGEKYALLRMAQADRDEMAKTIGDKAKDKREKRKALQEAIRDLFTQAGIPLEAKGEDYRIESYDISNTNGVDSVGAMVVFRGMQRVYRDYRRFRIKTIEGADDYGSLREMIYRRFRRAEKGDPAFNTMPDLILMDGGLGQVHAASQVLKAMGKEIPVAGLAKDDRHRTDRLVFADGASVDLANHPLVYRYTGRIQEEVHRFAIEYHRKVRGKRAIQSVLDDIPGIGPARRNGLLRFFGSVDEIKKASPEQLEQAPTMNRKAAEAVYAFFHDSCQAGS